MLLKQLLKKAIYREKSSSENYINWLRRQGVTIGKGCTVYDPRSTHIDTQNPGMLEIRRLCQNYSWNNNFDT